MTTSRGAEFQARIDRIGIPKSEFAERAHMDRSTLDRVLVDDPSVRPRTAAKVENTLAALEEELSMAEAGRTVTSTITVNGATVTIQGTPDDVASTVRKILRNR